MEHFCNLLKNLTANFCHKYTYSILEYTTLCLNVKDVLAKEQSKEIFLCLLTLKTQEPRSVLGHLSCFSPSSYVSLVQSGVIAALCRLTVRLMINISTLGPIEEFHGVVLAQFRGREFNRRGQET